MNFKKFFSVGIKVLAAAVAGVAVFIGLGKSFEHKNPQRNNNNPQEDTRPQGNSNFSNNPQQSSPQNQNQNNQEPTKSQKVVGGFKKFQDTCGKIFGVAQSLSTLAENLHRIFNGNGNQQQQESDPTCPPGFRRISPYIIEAAYTPPSNRSNNQYWC